MLWLVVAVSVVLIEGFNLFIRLALALPNGLFQRPFTLTLTAWFVITGMAAQRKLREHIVGPTLVAARFAWLPDRRIRGARYDWDGQPATGGLRTWPRCPTTDKPRRVEPRPGKGAKVAGARKHRPTRDHPHL